MFEEEEKIVFHHSATDNPTYRVNSRIDYLSSKENSDTTNHNSFNFPVVLNILYTFITLSTDGWTSHPYPDENRNI